MAWRFRNRQDESLHASTPSRPRRPDRRFRPTTDGLEGRQLLSVAVMSPDPGVGEGQGVPVTIRYTQLAPIRAWAGQEYNGVVASFISNSAIASDRLVATVDWGDGQSGPGTVEPNPWGGFLVRGTHEYAPNLQGPGWIRVDLADTTTGEWVTGVEQRVFISRASPARASLFASGSQVPGQQVSQPAQPARLQFVERRQRYHDAADRHAQGTASVEDLRYLKQVLDFHEKQNRSYFQKIGDNFVNSIPFT